MKSIYQELAPLNFWDIVQSSLRFWILVDNKAIFQSIWTWVESERETTQKAEVTKDQSQAAKARRRNPNRLTWYMFPRKKNLKPMLSPDLEWQSQERRSRRTTPVPLKKEANKGAIKCKTKATKQTLRHQRW